MAGEHGDSGRCEGWRFGGLLGRLEDGSVDTGWRPEDGGC